MSTSTETLTTDLLVEQLDWHWTNQARPRLDGLTDAEYLWEPVPGCWSIRPRSEVGVAGVGAGDAVVDFAPDPGDPAPVTTIAWRLAHVTVGVFGTRAANHFGEPGTVEYDTTDYSLAAAGGLAQLDEQYAAWMAGVSGLDEDALRAPCGPAEGPYADKPFATLVLHINREAIHHLAEVALLRDLYANGAAR